MGESYYDMPEKSEEKKSPRPSYFKMTCYTGLIAAAFWIGFSAANVPIEINVGRRHLNNQQTIKAIDDLFSESSHTDARSEEPAPDYNGPLRKSTAGPGPNF